jgi:hypothetical protein
MSMPHFRPLFAALLLVAVPLCAAEIPLTEPRTIPAALSQSGALVASDGDGYLALWNDSRTSAGQYVVRATRVTRDGTVLDRTGIPLPIGSSAGLSVTWTGTSYLVLWGSYEPAVIRALRIDRDGNIIDGPRVIARDFLYSSLAHNGSEIVIGAMPYPSNGPVEPHALFLTPDAVVTGDVKLSAAPTGGSPVIAWNGSHYAAVWINNNFGGAPGYRLNGIRFLSSGTLDPEPQLIAEDTDILEPALASDGQGGFVLVTAMDGNALRVTRSISSDLRSVGPPQQIPGAYTNTSILWVGSHYLVVGSSGSWLIGARVDRQGRSLDSEQIVIEKQKLGDYWGVPATNGDDLFFAWSGYDTDSLENFDQNVYATRVSASTFDVRSRSLLSFSAPRQVRPMLASGSTNLLAVWTEAVTVYAKRLARDGTPLDEAPIALPEFSSVTDVVFNGTDYIVIGGNRFGSALLTLRIHGDGALRADGGMRIADAWPVAAASDGTTTLLLWSNYELAGTGASRLREDGTFLDPTPLLAIHHDTQSIDLASNGAGEFLAVWSEVEYTQIGHGGYERADVRAARITSELVMRDAGGFDVALSPYYELNPAVTWNGREWLVLWDDGQGKLSGRTVTADGKTPEAEAFIATGIMNASVAWDGSRYHVGWAGLDLHLHTAQLPRLGGPLVNPRDLGDVPADSRYVYLVPLARDTMAAVYARRAEEQTYGGVSRAFVNVLKVEGRRRAVR